MNDVQPSSSSDSVPLWLCLRSQPKHEHIAAAHLRRMVERIEVFCPRLRIRRRTRRGVAWFVQAVFPGYLFARFDPRESMLHVRAVPGVKTIVSFGERMPSIPPDVIAGLKGHFDENEFHEVHEEIQPGDEVAIAGGPFHGMTAAVLNVKSATGRVQVLLEMLGRCTPVEVSREQIVMENAVRSFIAV